MAESAADRKARLKALRASRDGGDDGGGDAKKLKFRNYLPQSEALSANFEAPASLPKPDLGDDGAAARPIDVDGDDDDAPWTCAACTYEHASPAEAAYLACALCATPRTPA